jgi:hypothetical protein
VSPSRIIPVNLRAIYSSISIAVDLDLGAAELDLGPMPGTAAFVIC